MSADADPLDREAPLWNEDNLWKEDDLPDAAVSAQFDSWLCPDLLSWVSSCYTVLSTMYEHYHQQPSPNSNHPRLRSRTPDGHYSIEFHSLLTYCIEKLLLPAINVLCQKISGRDKGETTLHGKYKDLRAKVLDLRGKLKLEVKIKVKPKLQPQGQHTKPGQASSYPCPWSWSWSRPLVQLFLLSLAERNNNIKEPEQYRDEYQCFLKLLPRDGITVILPNSIFVCTGPHSREEHHGDHIPSGPDSHSIGTSVEKWFRKVRRDHFKLRRPSVTGSKDHLGDWPYGTRRRLMQRLATKSHPNDMTAAVGVLQQVQEAGDTARCSWQQSARNALAQGPDYYRYRQNILDKKMRQDHPDHASRRPNESATIFNGLTAELMPRCAKCYSRVERRFPPELTDKEQAELNGGGIGIGGGGGGGGGQSQRRAFKGDTCAEDTGLLDCARLLPRINPTVERISSGNDDAVIE